MFSIMLVCGCSSSTFKYHKQSGVKCLSQMAGEKREKQGMRSKPLTSWVPSQPAPPSDLLDLCRKHKHECLSLLTSHLQQLSPVSRG